MTNPIPRTDEFKRQNAVRNSKNEMRNKAMVANAIGKTVRVKIGKNQFLTGIICAAELAQFGTAKIWLECGVEKVIHGPYYTPSLPR